MHANGSRGLAYWSNRDTRSDQGVFAGTGALIRSQLQLQPICHPPCLVVCKIPSMDVRSLVSIIWRFCQLLAKGVQIENLLCRLFCTLSYKMNTDNGFNIFRLIPTIDTALLIPILPWVWVNLDLGSLGSLEDVAISK